MFGGNRWSLHLEIEMDIYAVYTKTAASLARPVPLFRESKRPKAAGQILIAPSEFEELAWTKRPRLGSV